MRSLNELKLRGVQPAPTREDVFKVEQYLGYSLPKIYSEFLEHANGGHPEIDTFEDSDGEQWAVNNFFSIKSQGTSDELIWNHQHRWSGIPESFLPIARDGFGNLFLLNVEIGFPNGVWIWVHDEPDNQLKQLASNFEEFVDRLRSNPDYI